MNQASRVSPDDGAENPPSGKPPAEVEVSPDLVRRLLRQQMPDLADLPVRAAGSGWDNEIFRLGEELLVRMPRRKLGAELVLNEQRLLPKLAPRLPLPVPTPLRAGKPGCGYPWSWSVAPWSAGEPADGFLVGAEVAAELAEFLTALHLDDTEGAPDNPFRDGPLREKTPVFEERWKRLQAAGQKEADDSVRRLRLAADEIPPPEVARWIHGDLHPGNLLVKDGKICSVIDWGDLTAADFATDLAVAWMLFEEASDRDAFLATHPLADSNARVRAMGWAIHLAVSFLDFETESDSRAVAIGLATLRRVRQDGPSFTAPRS